MTRIKATVEEGGRKEEISIEEFGEWIERVKALENVTVKNGDIKTIPTPQAIAEIWEAVELLRDAKSIVAIFKKHPVFMRVTKWLFLGGGILTVIKWIIDYSEWAKGLLNLK